MFWGLSVVLEQSVEKFLNLNEGKIASDIYSCSSLDCFWKDVDVETKEFEMVFFSTGSHYYKSIMNRYTFVANYLNFISNVNFTSHIKNKQEFDYIMAQNPSVDQFKNFKLSKTDPVSATVYDILNDVQSTNFIIRPDYQRSEVANNIQKASYLLESVLLGIRIPPIFIYKRDDNISEVIDGQQRLLSILGFLQEHYRDEEGNEQLSNKHGFKLTKLRFLKELNGNDISGVEEIDKSLKDRILDFQIDIVEINQSQNPNFSPIDLFLRLNSKPFPIEANTFEMWNAFVAKEFLDIIKKCANNYAGKLFKPVDTRMKNEELITILAYLAYIEKKDSINPGEYLNIFVRNQRINARISTKSHITNRLTEISSNYDPLFKNALQDVEAFIEKLQILCGENFEKFNSLIAHTKKNTQSRTNQNFYLLWIAVAHIEKKRLENEKEEIFKKIKNMFLISQDIKDDEFDVKNYIKELSQL